MERDEDGRGDAQPAVEEVRDVHAEINGQLVADHFGLLTQCPDEGISNRHIQLLRQLVAQRLAQDGAAALFSNTLPMGLSSASVMIHASLKISADVLRRHADSADLLAAFGVDHIRVHIVG